MARPIWKSYWSGLTCIEMDSYYQQQKEKELKRLRRQAGDAITDEERLCYLDSSIVPIVTIATTSLWPDASKKGSNWQKLPITPFISLASRYTGHPCCRLEDSMTKRKTIGHHSTRKQMPYTSRSCITTSRTPGCIITGNPTQPNRNLPTTSKPRRSII